jgi:AraC-like DNA-binding protein
MPTTPQTRVWRLAAMPGLELLHAELPTSGFPREVHEALSVGLLECGGEIYQHRMGNDVASPEDISFVNPLEPHASRAATAEGFVYRAFQFDPDWLVALTLEATGRSQMVVFRQPTVQDAALAGRLLELHRDLESPLDALEVGVRVRLGLLELLRRYGDTTLLPSKPEHSVVAVVLEYLEAHLGENTSLERLADLVQLSPFHLAKSFAKMVGVPPHIYQTARRVERAKGLLRQGIAPAEVALAVGFFDQSHLNKKFKGLVGVTSGVYQQTTRTS